MRSTLFLACLLLLAPSSPTFARGDQLRTWTSSDGNYVVRAELVDVDDKEVRLRKPDGSVLSVPLSKLSAADRAFLAGRGAGKVPAGSSSEAEKSARAALEKLGLRAISSGLVLIDESKFSKMLRDALELQKSVKSAESALVQQEKQGADLKRQIDGLTVLDVNLNAQLANIRPGDATGNNKLVAAINANRSQVELLRSTLEQQETATKSARGSANDSREAFIQAVLEMRTTADHLAQQYAQLQASDEAQQAIAQWNAASGKKVELTESRNFRQTLKRLVSLEGSVLSEEISLRRVGGGSLIVSVVINGKHTQEMVLDSGANLVTMPQEVADQCGIQIADDDPRIVMSLADGSRITGRLVNIPAMRVGQFAAENVPCAVLGAEATNAPCLLGMSFLEHFKFQVDAAKGTLKMVQIRDEDPAPRN